MTTSHLATHHPSTHHPRAIPTLPDLSSHLKSHLTRLPSTAPPGSDCPFPVRTRQLPSIRPTVSAHCFPNPTYRLISIPSPTRRTGSSHSFPTRLPSSGLPLPIRHVSSVLGTPALPDVPTRLIPTPARLSPSRHSKPQPTTPLYIDPRRPRLSASSRSHSGPTTHVRSTPCQRLPSSVQLLTDPTSQLISSQIISRGPS